MAYIPQFIPTNTQALQGTLDQYQKASDQQTAIQNQANDMYSSIPTTRTYDTAKKNEVMNQFSNVLDDLDKKYNYDRSNTQYSKELTGEITKLRSNPLWAHIQQKDELDKQRQQLIAQRGVNYHENFNPNDVTLDNAKQLQNWKPVDIRDVKQAAASWAKEFATSLVRTTVDKSNPGIIKYTDYFGPTDMGEATQFLNGQKKLNGINGAEALNTTIAAAGFDPNDPAIRGAAHDAFLTEAVGKKQDRFEEDRNYLAEQARLAKQKTPILPIQVSTGQVPTGTATPYPVKSLKEVPIIDKNIKDLQGAINTTTDVKQKAVLIDQLQEIQKQKGDIINAKTSIESLPENQKIIDAGHQVINTELGQYKTFITGDKSQDIYDIIHEGFTNGENKDKLALKVTSELQKYKDPNRKVSRQIVNSIARDVVSKMDDWYNSKGNYVTNGYYPVKQQIEKELSTGKQPIYNEYSLPSEMENNGAKGEILKMIADNTNALSKVDNTSLSESEANSFAQAFKNENTQFHWLTDNQGSVLLKLNYPGDGNKQDPVKGTFKINPATASFGLLKNLANRTGDSGFMSQIYSNFNLTPNKNYSINDKDGYLASRLGKLFPSADGKVDVKAFKGFKIRYIEDPISKETRYEVTDPQGIAHVAANKIELLEALADYKQNSDAYHQ